MVRANFRHFETRLVLFTFLNIFLLLMLFITEEEEEEESLASFPHNLIQPRSSWTRSVFDE